MRFAVLVSSLVIQLCLGGLYAWSSLAPGLTTSYGLSMAQTQLVFGLLIAMFTVTMVFAGRMLKKWGPRRIAIIGGCLFCAGYVIAHLSGGRFSLLLLGVGITAGAGTGFGYVCPLIICMKWFPKHKGLVTGITVAGFGLGAVLMSSLVEVFFARGMDVLDVFLWIGVSYGALVIGAALVLREPHGQTMMAAQPVLRPVSLLREPFFLALVVGMFCGTFSGLLIIGNLKPLASLAGASPVQTTVAVSIFAIGNASGRIAWGWLADRLSTRTIALPLAFLTCSLILLGLAASSALGVIGASFLVGFGFGACFIVYAEAVASRYGADGMAQVYPLVFLAYGAAGIAGPWVGGWLYDATGAYGHAIVVSIAVLIAGSIASLWLLKRARPQEAGLRRLRLRMEDDF